MVFIYFACSKKQQTTYLIWWKLLLYFVSLWKHGNFLPLFKQQVNSSSSNLCTKSKMLILWCSECKGTLMLHLAWYIEEVWWRVWWRLCIMFRVLEEILLFTKHKCSRNLFPDKETVSTLSLFLIFSPDFIFRYFICSATFLYVYMSEQL